jgi:hypothetical protein
MSFDTVDFFKSMNMTENFLKQNYTDPLPAGLRIKSKLSSSAQVMLDRIYLFKNTYDCCINKKTKVGRGIPKVIHQIWIGENPFPENLRFCVDSVKRMYPDWEYHFWTNDTIKKLDLRFEGLINNPSINIGKRADILMYEILNKFGGLYLDVDTFCCKRVDDLHDKFKFYGGIAPSRWFVVGAGIVGSIPGHPIIKSCLDTLTEEKVRELSPSGVGPWRLTLNIVDFLEGNKDNDTLVLPVTYFYSLPGWFRLDFWKGSMMLDDALQLTRPESCFTHVWSATWLDNYTSPNHKLYDILDKKGFIWEGATRNSFIDSRRACDKATPAIEAVIKNMPDILDILGKFGANFNLKDSNGLSALDHALILNFKKCARVLQSYSGRYDLVSNDLDNNLIDKLAYKPNSIDLHDLSRVIDLIIDADHSNVIHTLLKFQFRSSFSYIGPICKTDHFNSLFKYYKDEVVDEFKILLDLSIDKKRRKKAADIIKASQYVGAYLETNEIQTTSKLIYDIQNLHRSDGKVSVLMSDINKGRKKEARPLLDIIDS